LLNALGFRLDIFKNPVLVVVKKNKRILENLEKWLTEFNAGPNKKIDAPVLVIDDEADNASVNTRPTNEDPTGRGSNRFAVWPTRSQGRRGPGCQVNLRTWRSTGRGRRSPRQRSDRRSLSQTAEQFGMLIDELVDRREKRRWR
jgi:hypothetical protein